MKPSRKGAQKSVTITKKPQRFTEEERGAIRDRAQELKDDKAVVHHATRATAQMWIESPLDRGQGGEDSGEGEDGAGKRKGSWLNRAFDTHPPLDERIRILKEM